ncbi:hypothetical protein GSI_09846 [Ganoderma sinense ZZ0214-1]|uniref:F-box domain-containing protein n=1 Tax=Ganoderma sinense ZZ0214-1 TaxID=1077348 RepID=A0A2G8S2J9_9APHY|nr:hypothetical protein GSI_09846 [Ganoderma sinense ZZ0214-1]
MGQRTSGFVDLTNTNSQTISLPNSKQKMPSMSSRVLNDDVILDHILPNLDLKDILAVRQVSDQMRQCSNQPAVWKRILANTGHRLPPLPPTARYSLANLSRFEAERLYTRSVSLPTQWDQDQPRCVRRWEIDAQRKVLEMALLPGGQYLVASVRDRNPTRHSIEVFASDFQYSMGFPFARFTTPTKAFNLRAKYLTFQGQPGIVIAYIRRDYRREKFKSEFDVNRIMPDSDWFSSKVKYECVVLHVPLKSLEHLFNNDVPWDCREYHTRARQQPRPFQVLTEITSRARMSVPVIDEDRNGTPFVAVLKHPDRIVYKNLDGGLGCTMYCEPHPTYDQLPHAIMAFTFLRHQHQFLLVRRAGDDPDVLDPAATAEHLAELAPDEDPSGPYYFAELYNVDALCAPGTSSTRVAAQWTAVHDAGWNFWRHVWITDPSAGLALHADASVHAPRPQGPAKPPPITIFVQAVRSYGLVFNTFFPEPVPAPLHGTGDGQTEEGYGYTFVLSADDAFIETDPLPEGVESLNNVYEHRVLLGATRPVIYTIPREGSRAHSFKIQMLGGVWDEGLLDRPLSVPLLPEETQEGVGPPEDDVDDGDGDVENDDDAEDEDAAMVEGVDDDDGVDEMGGDEDAPQGDGDGGGDGDEPEDGAEDEDGMSDIFEDSSRIRVSHQFDVALEDLGDVSAIAWDETIGRLCIGYAGNSKIAVFDFAGAPVPVDTHA